MKKKNAVTLSVEQEPDRPVEHKVLASAIVEISSTLRRLLKSGLTEDSICVLVHSKCRAASSYSQKPGLVTVREVILQIKKLEEWATRKN